MKMIACRCGPNTSSARLTKSTARDSQLVTRAASSSEASVSKRSSLRARLCMSALMNRVGSPSCSSRHSQNAWVSARTSKMPCHVAISALLPLPDGALSRQSCQASRSSSADDTPSSITTPSDSTGASNLRCRKRGVSASARLVAVACMTSPNRRGRRHSS